MHQISFIDAIRSYPDFWNYAIFFLWASWNLMQDWCSLLCIHYKQAVSTRNQGLWCHHRIAMHGFDLMHKRQKVFYQNKKRFSLSLNTVKILCREKQITAILDREVVRPLGCSTSIGNGVLGLPVSPPFNRGPMALKAWLPATVGPQLTFGECCWLLLCWVPVNVIHVLPTRP